MLKPNTPGFKTKSDRKLMNQIKLKNAPWGSSLPADWWTRGNLYRSP